MNPDHNRIPYLVTLVLAVFLSANPAFAGTELMILVDASGSVAAPGTAGTGHTKYDEIKAGLNTMLQSIPTEIEVGLRVMGGSPTSDCFNTYLYYPPSQGFRSVIQDYLDSIHPAGSRALLQGIEDGLGDLAGDEGETRILLVVTGGPDDCGRDFDDLIRILSYESHTPRIVILAANLSNDDSRELGELASETGGRLTNFQSTAEFNTALLAFSMGFDNNLQIHLLDSFGNAVDGDIIITNTSTNEIVAELLDIPDYSVTVPLGSYQVMGRYLGQEIISDVFQIQSGSTETISLEFTVYQEPFTLTLRDLYGMPFRARVTFENSMGDAVVSTELDSIHRVLLPPDIYTVIIKYGDQQMEIYGVRIGPGQEPTLDYEVPVELATLQVEVSNFLGTPLNAKVEIFDLDGALVEEAPFTSYLYSTMPPGEYRIVASFEGIQNEETVYIYPGETRQVGLEIDVELGDIFVMLRTESGNDVWGWVKIYDMNGNLLERFDRERIESPDWFFTNIPIGIYKIEAEADNMVRVYNGIEVRPDEETEVLVTFPDEVY